MNTVQHKMCDALHGLMSLDFANGEVEREYQIWLKQRDVRGLYVTSESRAHTLGGHVNNTTAQAVG